MADNTLKYHLENNFFPSRFKVLNTQEICLVECLNKDCDEKWEVTRENFNPNTIKGGTICKWQVWNG